MQAPSWDLSIAYSGIDDPHIEHDLLLVKEGINQLEEWHSQAAETAVLQRALSKTEEVTVTAFTVAEYVDCLLAVNSEDSSARKLSGRIDVLLSELSEASEPFDDHLVRMPQEQLDLVLSAEDELGPLNRFAFQVGRSRLLRDSRLSVAEEQLLAAMTVDGRNAWGRLYDRVTGGLDVHLEFGGGRVETMGLSQAASILYGGDSERREPAWRAIRAAMDTHSESIAAILNALSGWRISENRKRSTVSEVHFLDPSLHDSRIDQATLDCLMGVARDQAEIGRKAARLMAEVYGTDALEPWDQLAAMPAGEGHQSRSYSFQEGIDLIRECFNGVHPEMGEFVDMMVKNQWIDAAPGTRKRLGAFCSGFSAHRIPVVFMTWGDSMSDVLTLAHELGHAFHSWVMRDLPFAENHYPMTLAETASIFAESVVRDALLEQAETDRERCMMLWEEVSSVLGFMINIPVRYEFEKSLYERRADGELGVDDLCALMDQTWSSWYADSMTRSDDMFWASKLHFSIADVSFYNYPYLFGYLFSKGVYARRGTSGEQFFPDYVELLRATGRMTAEDLAQQYLGVDLREPDFWLASVEIARAQVDEFERLLRNGV